MKRIFFLFSLVLLFQCQNLLAKQRIAVAVLTDLGASQSVDFEAQYVEELKTLVESEFELEIVEFEVDWKNDNFSQQFEAVYKNSEIDMVLVLGFAANQIAIRRGSFSKPTFLPFVVESELIGAPNTDGASGVANLSYLTFSTQFTDSLDILGRVSDYSNLAIIADELVLGSLPVALQEELLQQEDDLKTTLIAHDGEDHNLLDRIGEEIDAVMLGHLPRLPDVQLQELIDGLIVKKLPGFTYLGEGLVERGLLATPINRSLFAYAARRNALNMQAVMLGEPASKLPVLVDIRPRLTINQNTAERIGLAVDFKTLIDSDVIGFGLTLGETQYNLISLTATAIENNLEIKNQGYDLAIQESRKESTKGRLRPQLSATASLLKRKNNTGAVLTGLAPETTSDVAITLSQTLFSDSELANYKIQKLLSEASSEQFRQTQLDVIRQSSLAMADVLQAQAEAEIQRENIIFAERNLELALDRVKLGATSSADQFRWETQVANARAAIFAAYSRALSAQHVLAQVLNLPVEPVIEIDPFAMQQVSLFESKELFALLDNADTFERVYQLGLEEAFERSPEITRLQALTRAKDRELKSLNRQGWLPQISLSGQVTENIDQSSIQPGSGGEQDWNIMLNARIPFYQGGQLKAQRQTAKLELAQLENQLIATRLQISTQLRTSMNSLLNALFNLDFTKTAASAASRSLSLVTDAYSKGAVPIVDLLDAQNSSINADLAEVQASIGYFRAHIEMQRVIGVYEFLMSEQQKEIILQRFKEALNGG